MPKPTAWIGEDEVTVTEKVEPSSVIRSAISKLDQNEDQKSKSTIKLDQKDEKKEEKKEEPKKE